VILDEETIRIEESEPSRGGTLTVTLPGRHKENIKAEIRALEAQRDLLQVERRDDRRLRARSVGAVDDSYEVDGIERIREVPVREKGEIRIQKDRKGRLSFVR